MTLGKGSTASTSVRKKHSARETKGHMNVIQVKEEGFKVRYPVGCTKKKKSEDMTARKLLSSRMPYGLKDRSPLAGSKEMKE